LGSPYNVPSDVFPVDYVQKANGFYGFRANFVVRLQVNANRFQQGRILLYYKPYPYRYTYFDVTGNTPASLDLYSVTQLPRVELDLSTETEVTLVIPYYSPFPWYPLTDSGPLNYAWGKFDAVMYGALVDPSGSTGVDYVLWGHYEDVELVMPALPFGATDGGAPVRAIAAPAISTNFVAHAGTPRGKRSQRGKGESYTDSEINPKTGTVSRSLASISTAAGALSALPIIGTYLAPVSWATGILSKTAAAFGFSKPTTEESACISHLQSMPDYSHADGSDSSKKLTLLKQAKVAELPNYGGVDIDEMSFAHMMSVPGFIGAYSWSTTGLQGDLVFDYLLGPGSPDLSLVQNQVIRGPAVSVIPRMFKYWRGGFKFKLKFVKTEFHSGRLLVAFNPKLVPGYGQIGISNSFYLHRDVIDIRTNTEYEFSIPYVSARPYTTIDSYIGELTLMIANPLRAPTTVSQTIDIIVEVSALPDFEVAAPTGQVWYNDGTNIINSPVAGAWSSQTTTVNLPPVAGAVGVPITAGKAVPIVSATNNIVASTKTATTPVVVDPTFVAHGGEPLPSEASDLDRDVSPSQGFSLGDLSPTTAIKMDPSQLTIGERINSLRQLLKRFEPYAAPISPDGSGAITSNGTFLMLPNNMGTYQANTGTAPVTSVWNNGGMPSALNYFAQAFCFMRGATRIKLVPGTGLLGMYDAKIVRFSSGNVNLNAISPASDPNESTSPIYTYVYNYGYANAQYNRSQINGALEIESPFYQITPFTSVLYNELFNQPCIAVQMQLDTVPSGNDPSVLQGSFVAHRAVADDFSLGFYTGCPPLRVELLSANNNGNTNPYINNLGVMFQNNQENLYSGPNWPAANYVYSDTT